MSENWTRESVRDLTAPVIYPLNLSISEKKITTQKSHLNVDKFPYFTLQNVF